MTSHLRRGGAGLLAAVAVCLVLAAPSRADTTTTPDAVTQWHAYATNALSAAAVPGAPVCRAAPRDGPRRGLRRRERHRPPLRALPVQIEGGAALVLEGSGRRDRGPPRARRPSARAAAGPRAALRRIAGARPAGTGADGGVAVGAAAAATMLVARANDGRFGPPGFPVGTAPGQWRPTPPALVNDPNAWLARVRPFLIPSTAHFRSAGRSRSGAAGTRRSSTRSRPWARRQARPDGEPDRTPRGTGQAASGHGSSLRPAVGRARPRHRRERAALRDALPHRRGRRDRLLGRQGRWLSGGRSPRSARRRPTGTTPLPRTPAGCRSSTRRRIRSTRPA